jgi:hypothetical protein
MATVPVIPTGEQIIENVSVINGDIVYLANQGTGLNGQNGLYIVRVNAWEVITTGISDFYIDLGAKAIDSEDGDLTRSIVTDLTELDFTKTGFYSIKYSATNSIGNTTTISRKLEIVLADNAEIVPTNGVIIADYYIDTEIEGFGSLTNPQPGSITTTPITFTDNHILVSDKPILQKFTVDSLTVTNQKITLSSPPTGTNIKIWLDGVLLINIGGDDYTISGNNILFDQDTKLSLGDSIAVEYYQ